MSSYSTTPSQVQQPSNTAAPGCIMTYKFDCKKWLTSGQNVSSPTSTLYDITAGTFSGSLPSPTLATDAAGIERFILQEVPSTLLTAGHSYRLIVVGTVTSTLIPPAELDIVCPA